MTHFDRQGRDDIYFECLMEIFFWLGAGGERESEKDGERRSRGWKMTGVKRQT